MKASNSIAKGKKSRVTDKEADRIFNQLKKAPATCIEDDVGDIDRDLMTGNAGVMRRVAIMLLTKPGKFVIDLAKGDRAHAVSMAEGMLSIRHEVKRLRELADIMQSAEMRMGVALCIRADMQEILAEAKAMEANR